MSIRFAVDIEAVGSLAGQGTAIDRARLVDLAKVAESAGIDQLLIAERREGLDAATVASCALHATATLGVRIEQFAGVHAPEIAARRIATLDQLSEGRVAVHVGPPRDERSHAEAFAELDEYLALMKRLWLNDQPIDFEGQFHRLRSALSGAKPFNGASVPLALGGVSGTAISVAAKHADLFVLPAADVHEMRGIIERVRVAVASHRRADAARFALPVRPTADLNVWPATAGKELADAVAIPLAPDRAVPQLVEYGGIGVTDFTVLGLRSVGEISAFGRAVAARVRRILTPHDEIGSLANLTELAFVRPTRYPA